MKKAGNTGNHTHPAGAGLTVDRIDELLTLLRELVNWLELESRKDPVRWGRFINEVLSELPDRIKKRSAQAIRRAGSKNLNRSEFRKLMGSKYENGLYGGAVVVAEMKYRRSNPEYAKARQKYEDKVWELFKKIDNLLSPLREELCKFSRTEGTLLRMDWRDMREELTVFDLAFGLKPLLSEAVDALDAVRVEVEQQQPEPTQTEPDVKHDFLSAWQISEKYHIRYNSLRKRLERFRQDNVLNSDAFIESQNRGRNKPKYFYNVDMVSPIIKSLKDKMSIKRPSRRK